MQCALNGRIEYACSTRVTAYALISHGKIIWVNVFFSRLRRTRVTQLRTFESGIVYIKVVHYFLITLRNAADSPMRVLVLEKLSKRDKLLIGLSTAFRPRRNNRILMSAIVPQLFTSFLANACGSCPSSRDLFLFYFPALVSSLAFRRNARSPVFYLLFAVFFTLFQFVHSLFSLFIFIPLSFHPSCIIFPSPLPLSLSLSVHLASSFDCSLDSYCRRIDMQAQVRGSREAIARQRGREGGKNDYAKDAKQAVE